VELLRFLERASLPERKTADREERGPA
jgi:hypothetical protein